MIIPAGMLIEGEGHLDWKPHQVRLGATLEGGGDILLVICDNGRPDLRQGLVLCQALARLISPYSSYIGGMVSTGGETTNALLSIMERSEEHTSELQSLMRISYAVFCLKKKI